MLFGSPLSQATSRSTSGFIHNSSSFTARQQTHGDRTGTEGFGVYFQQVKTQHHRLGDVSRTSGSIWSHHGHVSAGFPALEGPQLSEVPAYTHSATVLPGVQGDPPVLQFAPAAFCPAAGHHCHELGFILSVPSHPPSQLSGVLPEGPLFDCFPTKINSTKRLKAKKKRNLCETQCPCPRCWTSWQLLQILGFAIYTLPVVLWATQPSLSGEMIPVMDRTQSWVLQHLSNPFRNKTLKFLGV